MKKVLLPVLAIAAAASFTSCSNESQGPVSSLYCDTVCVTDTIRYYDDALPEKPYVYISFNDCKPDSITWYHKKMDGERKMSFKDLAAGNEVRINPANIEGYIQGTKSAFIALTDCENGMGFQFRLPFNKKDNIQRSNKGLNKYDAKYAIEDGLIVHTDKGNLFVEEGATGKTAMITFGQQLDFEYNDMHKGIDSVNISRNKIWAKIKVDKDWKEISKDIELKEPVQ